MGVTSRRIEVAHRVAWRLYRGEIPSGQFVLHTCDNRRCVNPDHLFLGTARDNVADMYRKGRARPAGGRWRTGAEAFTPRLTAESVRAIRSSKLLTGELARLHGVHRSTILKVLNRVTWRDV
jgi:hypothetical protein